MKWVTVGNMYNQLEENEKLLSSFNADFWEDYNNNHAIYDRRFKRMFGSFRFFEQTPVECREPSISEIENVKDSFIEAVYEHLLINSKKYSELYRINVVPDTDYSIIDNYNVVETMDKDTTKSASDVFGSHTDNESEQVGSREDSNITTVGEQNNTATNTIAGFNSDDFENDRQVDDSIGERTDESTTTIGAQSNSITKQFGSKTDTHSDNGTEDYVLTRKGNIGVKTATEVMNEHKKFWDIWEFYSYIFKEISADLLLI